jgi:predicted acetyltransferase
MTRDADPLQVELLPASLKQKPVLDDLFQFYARDFSEFHPVELDADGRFHYPHLDAYWRDPGRFPFLVTVHHAIAGFVLVQQGSQISGDPSVWDMAEFFVALVHRRHGIGTAVARAVWTRFPGSWEVRVTQSNREALTFWSAAVRDFVGQAVEPIVLSKETSAWRVFSFESPGPR